jgi:GTP cyclohydrolase II
MTVQPTKRVRSRSVAPLARPHAVNRALADLRCGEFVLLRASTRSTLVLAAEVTESDSLQQAIAMTGQPPILAVTRRRAIALGLAPLDSVSANFELMLPADVSATSINELADPTLVRTAQDDGIRAQPAPRDEAAAAAIELARLARLLPAMALFALSAASAALLRQSGVIELDEDIVFQHRTVLSKTLRRTVDANVPLADAGQSRIIAFRPDDGGTDHLAIVIGNPDAALPALVRIHSECFTGDLLGSLRCDCGEQLRGAIKAIAEGGGGLLVYLAQEGRGIGLVNKLRAYNLQDAGFDTIDANEQLGFEADERVYQPAAEILRQLGFARVRLLTNNPEKATALAHHGIEVVERVPHRFTATAHNQDYLSTKATRSGHLF